MRCIPSSPAVLLLALLLLLSCSLNSGQLLQADPWHSEGLFHPSFPSPSPAKAAVLTVSQFFNSSMVLQRAPHSARIWGTAAAGSAVSITVDSEEAVNGTADATGYWLISLPPHPARMGHTVQVASGSESVLFADVSFGDVYLCSGQSYISHGILPSPALLHPSTHSSLLVSASAGPSSADEIYRQSNMQVSQILAG